MRSKRTHRHLQNLYLKLMNKSVLTMMITFVFMVLFVLCVKLLAILETTGVQYVYTQHGKLPNLDYDDLVKFEPNPFFRRYANRRCTHCRITDRYLLVDAAKRCEGNRHIDIVVVINSRHSNVMLRHAIRDTWGNTTLMKSLKMTYVFVLGKSVTMVEEQVTTLESAMFGDIVVGDFEDVYNNLNIKTMVGFKWTTKYCSQAEYVFKTDDDVFLNVFGLSANLHKSIVTTTDIFGNCFQWAFPHRNPFSKWYSSFRFYPYRYYGAFCLGAALIMHKQAAQNLYTSARKVYYFHVEDVYISALTASDALANRYIMRGHHRQEKPILTCPRTSHDYSYLLNNVSSFYSLWGHTMKHPCMDNHIV